MPPRMAKLAVSGKGSLAHATAVALLLVCNLCLASILLADYPVLADIVTPLTGHVIGVGIAAALALVFPSHGWTTLTAGVLATLGLHAWLGVGPRFASASASAPAPVGVARTADISIVTLNTWDAVDNVDRLKAYFSTAPADVVVLSEIGPPKRALLEALKPIYPYQTECAATWECSLALVSRIPFEAGGAVHYSKDMPAFVWARFAGSLTVIGTHIFRPSRNPWLHVRETTAVARFIRNLEGSVVLVGDLNMSPWSYSFRSLKAQTGLQSPGHFTPSWPAWPLPVPQVALDHVLISSDLAFAAVRAGPAVGSDHLPMFAQLRRQPNTVERPKEPVRPGGLRLAAARAHLDSEFLADLRREHGGAGDLGR